MPHLLFAALNPARADQSPLIGAYEFEGPTIRALSATARVESPSFIAPMHFNSTLFVASETNDGSVFSFKVAVDGALQPINRGKCGGSSPCHLAAVADACLVVCNYASGSVSILRVSPLGLISDASCVLRHSGQGGHPIRQAGPHPHCCAVTPDGRSLLVIDLGIDAILVYDFDFENCRISEHRKIITPPGTGPRHAVFHPSARFLYVVNELESSVTHFAWDSLHRTLKAIKTVSTLPTGFSGQNFASDIRVSKCGAYLFASNRGHDSIALFAVQPLDGGLQFCGVTPSFGKTPRSFDICPNDHYLVIGNQDSQTLAVFEIDRAKKELMLVGVQASAGSPKCVRFWNSVN